MAEYALEINKLQKVYDNDVVALKGIDLKVKKGDFYALLGAVAVLQLRLLVAHCSSLQEFQPLNRLLLELFSSCFLSCQMRQ